jgi:hypothetical protein
VGGKAVKRSFVKGVELENGGGRGKKGRQKFWRKHKQKYSNNKLIKIKLITENVLG